MLRANSIHPLYHHLVMIVIMGLYPSIYICLVGNKFHFGFGYDCDSKIHLVYTDHLFPQHFHSNHHSLKLDLYLW